MKLTYWKAHCHTDADCYSLRAKTKKELLKLLAEHDCQRHQDGDWRNGYARYAHPVKVEVEYSDGFDLMQQCMGEGGLYEGHTPDDKFLHG